MLDKTVQPSQPRTPPKGAGRSLVSSWRGGAFEFAFYARLSGRGGCFTPRGAY
jgi:hypothetical protein